MRPLLLLVTVLGLACGGGSARDSLAEARQALAESRYSDALSAAEAGLVSGGDEVTRWGLELVRLEALARDGRGDETLALIEKLAGERPEQVPPSQYAASADQLRSADQRAAAIQVLDLGLRRFPDDPDLLGLIEAAKASPEPGSEELEMLRSLGYVE